jgi:hypothetical protein
MKLEQNLNKLLNIEVPEEPKEIIVYKEPEPPVSANTDTMDPDAKSDYDLSRKIYRKLITSGEEAIDNLNVIALETEHPRAFEVMATMISTIRETTKDLMDVHIKKKNINGSGMIDNKKLYQPNDINIEKAVFVGTLKELQEQKKQK